MDNLLNVFNDKNIIFFFAKAFAIFLSFFYLLYAIVMVSQVRVMGRTVQTASNGIIATVSLVQVGLAILILLVSILYL